MNTSPIPNVNVQSHDSLASIFLRFLRFGLLAWGGPVAQIAMIRHELVEEEQWVDTKKFNRVLGVYQALPGPEAHELCVYFGHLRRGRIGGVFAGLGFMLPGFVLMFALSWVYVTYGIESTIATGIFYGFAPAVAAIVVRAVHRIAGHALHDRWLIVIAVASGIAQFTEIHFALPLLIGGICYALVKRGAGFGAALLLVALVAVALLVFMPGETTRNFSGGAGVYSATPAEAGVSGLKTGLLTFGGAYTAIPFLQNDAVIEGDWLTQSEFLDGLALSSALPAPLIIFSTFVGYVSGGAFAALLMTIGIFAPAFAFTLVGHSLVERIVNTPQLHALLDGITAAVVGFIVIAALSILDAAVTDVTTALIALFAVVTLFVWKARLAIVGVLLAAGTVGIVVTTLN